MEVVIILQHIHEPNQHVVHLKFTQHYMPIISQFLKKMLKSLAPEAHHRHHPMGWFHFGQWNNLGLGSTLANG